eukprot:scaffold152109_cov19-Tisochrysis_lutea.AAC.1
MQILSLSSDQQLWAAFPVSGAASHPACPCCFFAEAALASLEAEARASEQAEAAAAEADVQALCDRWAALEAEATDKNAQQLLDLQLEQQELMQRQQVSLHELRLLWPKSQGLQNLRDTEVKNTRAAKLQRLQWPKAQGLRLQGPNHQGSIMQRQQWTKLRGLN